MSDNNNDNQTPHDLLDIFAFDEEEEEQIDHFNITNSNDRIKSDTLSSENNSDIIEGSSLTQITQSYSNITNPVIKPVSSYKNVFTHDIKPNIDVNTTNKTSHNTISTERYTGWKLLNRSIGACELEQKLHGYNNIKLTDIAIRMDRGKINGIFI